MFKKVLLTVVVLLLAAHNSFAQTATPTATATPFAVPSPTVNKGITRFGYVGFNNSRVATTPNTLVYAPSTGIGGEVVNLKATAALSIGQAVTLDTSNNFQVVTAGTGTAPHIIGVVVGRVELQQDQIGYGPLAGDLAIIQTTGVVQMVAAGSITRGDTVDAAAAPVAAATDGSAAGTADAKTIGMALNSTTAAGQVVYVLLEVARSY